MPKEVIATCQDEQLVVSWTKHDSLDPMIAVGSWKGWEDPSGEVGGRDPSGPQWALERDTVDKMISVLRRARDQVYNQASAPAPPIIINVHGSLLNAADLATQVQKEMLKLGMRRRVFIEGTGSDND